MLACVILSWCLLLGGLELIHVPSRKARLIMLRALNFGIVTGIWLCSHNLHQNSWMKVIWFAKRGWGGELSTQANLVKSQQDFCWDLWPESPMLAGLCWNCTLGNVFYPPAHISHKGWGWVNACWLGRFWFSDTWLIYSASPAYLRGERLTQY